PAAGFHKPAWTLFRKQDREGEDDCGNRSSSEHQAPTMGDLPGFAIGSLDEHVDIYRTEDAGDDSELIEHHKASANPGGSNLRDIHWRDDRGSAYTDSAYYAPSNVLRE